MTKVLITGCAGFIGSHLAEACLAKGWEVIGLDDYTSGRVKNVPAKIKMIDSSLTALRDSGIKQAIGEVDFFFHIAGIADIIPSIERPEDYFNANVVGTFIVAEFARKQKNLKKLMYAASASCYGMNGKQIIAPAYPYALSKYLGEQIIEHWGKVYKIPYMSLRLFNVYGDRQRTKGAYGAVFGTFLKQRLENKPLTIIGDGEQTRDFIHVKDVVNAFITGAENDEVNVTYDIGTGNGQSINHIADLIGGERVNIPKRPGEPDHTYAVNLPKWFKPKEVFDDEVKKMISNIDNYKDSPLWTPESIAEASKLWFRYLS